MDTLGAFHAAIVHMPIALIIVGAAFELGVDAGRAQGPHSGSDESSEH